MVNINREVGKGGSYMPENRMFDGREFEFWWSYESENDARHGASRLRERGFYTRIVHSRGHYEIWRREKKIKGKGK